MLSFAFPCSPFAFRCQSVGSRLFFSHCWMLQGFGILSFTQCLTFLVPAVGLPGIALSVHIVFTPPRNGYCPLSFFGFVWVYYCLILAVHRSRNQSSLSASHDSTRVPRCGPFGGTCSPARTERRQRRDCLARASLFGVRGDQQATSLCSFILGGPPCCIPSFSRAFSLPKPPSQLL